MSNNKLVRGLYNDDDVLLSGVKEIKSQGIEIKEVYSPFPIHGLDKALGLKDTRLAIAAFIYGITGTSLAILLTWYTMIDDWPMIIGGKPNFSFYENMPSFVPIMFELTVFCAAHLMVLTFLARGGYYPGQKAKNPDKRTTDDHFLMEIEITEDQTAEQIKSVLSSTGAIEITDTTNNI